MGELVIATRSGKVVVINETELPLEPRGGAGVRIAGIRPDDTIVAVAYVPVVAEAAAEAEADHPSEAAPPVPDDRRQAIIDVLASRMPHLREHGGRAWVETSTQTLQEMAADEQLIDLVDARANVNARLADAHERTTERFGERDALDTRIANRVTALFRGKANTTVHG